VVAAVRSSARRRAVNPEYCLSLGSKFPLVGAFFVAIGQKRVLHIGSIVLSCDSSTKGESTRCKRVPREDSFAMSG
jgi:hypothetical protein